MIRLKDIFRCKVFGATIRIYTFISTVCSQKNPYTFVMLFALLNIVIDFHICVLFGRVARAEAFGNDENKPAAHKEAYGKNVNNAGRTQSMHQMSSRDTHTYRNVYFVTIPKLLDMSEVTASGFQIANPEDGVH